MTAPETAPPARTGALAPLKHPIFRAVWITSLVTNFGGLIQSVGARWPYATTLFDYVRRAMPHHAPKSLTDDEVYAITAHLLHLNGLVGAEAVMERDSLPKVVMPGLARTVSAWPPGP